MADVSFNTVSGQTISRESLVAFLNVGTAEEPVWSPIGKRVEESSAEYDWDTETTRDILGNTFGHMKKPIVSQTFDPWDLDGGDAAQLKLWNLAVKDHDAQALANLDMLIAHFYAGTNTTPFAERYESCMVEVSELGGEGGGEIAMPITVTYGGTRTLGKVSRTGASVTFTPDD